jgi:hypothetical protein
MNKRGLELAFSTIVVIVLSILLLIALLFILNSQTGMFSTLLKNFQKNNVDSVVAICNSQASSGQEYSYCCDKKEVIINKEKSEMTCGEVKKNGYGEIQEIKCEIICQ